MRALALIPTLLLTACVQAAPVSPAAGPGASDAAPSEAGRIFAAMCLDTLPTLDGAEAAAARFPLTQNANTGTFYHNTQNLSFKLTGNQCSMVAATSSPDPTDFIVQTMTAADAAMAPSDARPDVSVSGAQGPDGKFYLNARTTASK